MITRLQGFWHIVPFSQQGWSCMVRLLLLASLWLLTVAGVHSFTYTTAFAGVPAAVACPCCSYSSPSAIAGVLRLLAVAVVPTVAETHFWWMIHSIAAPLWLSTFAHCCTYSRTELLITYLHNWYDIVSDSRKLWWCSCSFFPCEGDIYMYRWRHSYTFPLIKIGHTLTTRSFSLNYANFTRLTHFCITFF